MDDLPADIRSIILLKVLAIFGKSPTKFGNILNKQTFNNTALPRKKWLLIVEKLTEKLLYHVIMLKKVYYCQYKELIPFIKHLIPNILPLNNNTKFIALNILIKLKDANKLHLLNMCDETYLAKKDRPLSVLEKADIIRLYNYIAHKKNSFTEFFTESLSLGIDPILNSEDLSYILENGNWCRDIFSIIIPKRVYKVILFVEQIISTYPQYIPAIYSICQSLQINKTQENIDKTKLRVEQIKKYILSKFSYNCNAFQCCNNDEVYRDYVIRHLYPNYVCDCNEEEFRYNEEGVLYNPDFYYNYEYDVEF